MPKGHRVVTHKRQRFPCVQRAAGEVCIAFQGTTSDEPIAELEQLAREIEDAICGNRRQVVMALNVCRLSELFAPADVTVLPMAGVLLWVLDPVVVGSSLGPAFLQLLLRKIYTFATRATPQLTQFVYVEEFASPAGRLLAELVSTLGPPVRGADPDATVLLEVHRPEGVILSALAGRLFVPTEAADPYALQINEEKDRAEKQEDIAGLRRIEEQELEELARRLAPVRSNGAKVVTRAVRLCRLLLAVHEEHEESWRALCDELLRRDIPLLVIVDPKTRAATPRNWHGMGAAMPAFPDWTSLVRAANDLGIAIESLAYVEMAPRELFSWVGQQGFAVAINVFRDPQTPMYVWFRAEDVQTLAQGKVPQRTGRMSHPGTSDRLM